MPEALDEEVELSVLEENVTNEGLDDDSTEDASEKHKATSLVDMNLVDVSRFHLSSARRGRERRGSFKHNRDVMIQARHKTERRPTLGRKTSFTKAYVGKLADGLLMRPRGSSPCNETNEATSSFTTRAHRARVYRSIFSRILYSAVLLNIVILTPLWLKLLTLRRHETRKGEHLTLWNASIGIDLRVSTFDDPETECSRCSETVFGVTYPVSVAIEDFASHLPIPAASYVVLLASYNFKNWFTVSSPGYLTGLMSGSNDVQVCRSEEKPDDEDEDRESAVEKPADPSERTTAFMEKQRYEDGMLIEEFSESVTTWQTMSPTVDVTPVPTTAVVDENDVSRCCLDRPGFIYLVACVTPFEYLQRAQFYQSVDSPPFNNMCLSLAGRCGSACGVEAKVPAEETCIDGHIPMELLVGKDVLHRASKQRRLLNDRRRYYDHRFHTRSRRTKLYQNAFVCFITLMSITTWISFYAGTGYIDEPLKPSMSEVRICYLYCMLCDSSIVITG